MAISKNDKHKEYAHYAAHCLEMVPGRIVWKWCPAHRMRIFAPFNAKWRRNG